MGLMDRINAAAQESAKQGGGRPQREHKFLLSGLFTPAEVVTEPEEESKVVVAGLREAKVKREYSESPIKRVFEVYRADFLKLLRCVAIFIVSTLPIIIAITLGLQYYENYILGGTYNFMANIGVGYPGVGDSISQAVSIQQWQVYEPVFLMAVGAAFICSIFMPGLFYCAKRCYHQDSFKKIVITFFMGVKKYWWKFMICVFVGLGIVAAMGTSIFYLFSQQSLGTAGAGAYCAVVFTWVIGAPLLLIPMTMMTQFTQYNLTFIQTLKNALVFIFNTPFTIIITGLVCGAPLFLMFATLIVRIIAFIVIALAGYTLWALWLTAIGKRSMDKCIEYRNANLRKIQIAERQAQKANYNGQAKKKKPAQTYQNPKKKKKK